MECPFGWAYFARAAASLPNVHVVGPRAWSPADHAAPLAVALEIEGASGFVNCFGEKSKHPKTLSTAWGAPPS